MRPEARKRPRAILIAGPTASGKSALAVRLARRLGGWVINTDSMQVYRDLTILTARPTLADMEGIPHRLYGTVDGAQAYSVSLWLADASAALAQSEAEGAIPILVGGTGLYFKALTQGLSDIPAIPDSVRREMRAWSLGKSPAHLYAELARRDPVTAAALLPSDPQRVVRALEVHAATGESLKAFQGRRESPALSLDRTVAVALRVDRNILHERIDRRFDWMMQEGAIEEARALASRELSSTLPVMRAIGVPALLRYIGGAAKLDDAVAEAKGASRQYIKRQETFLRHQLPGFQPVTLEEAETLVSR